MTGAGAWRAAAAAVAGGASPPLVKICCILSPAEADRAASAGARVLGLVTAMPSGPGVIGEDQAAAIAAHVRRRWPGVATFLLTALTDADAIAAQHARCRTDALQLVDQVPLPELARLRRLCPEAGLVQVVHVLGERSLDEARAVAPWVDALLLDSGNPMAPVKELGGTGRRHDWAVSRRIRDAVAPLPLFLAGGLDAGNVAEAVDRVRPHGLDLCSRVRRDGVLDADRLDALFQALRRTACTPP